MEDTESSQFMKFGKIFLKKQSKYSSDTLF